MGEENVLIVKLFGKVSIEYNGRQFNARKNSTTKAMQLLEILFYRYPEGIARRELLEWLYGSGNALLDPANNLRVSVHRLKKLFLDFGLPDEPLIQNDGERYYWQGSFPVCIDIKEFEEYLKLAETAEGQEEAVNHRKKACDLYNGDFLEQLSGEDWVVVESIRYKKRYEEALAWLCKYLKEQGRYSELLQYVMKACELYPLEEWHTVKMECLMALGKYAEAMKVYKDTSALFFKELGLEPSEKILKLFRDMSQYIDYIPREITDFKQKICEKDADDGAYYCTLPSFVDGYRILQRMMERSGQSVFLMLCTLTDEEGNALENKDRARRMAKELKKTISLSLRKGDTFTQCSPTQFLVLLPDMQEENCDVISDRITKKFSENHKHWKNCVQYYITSLKDQEYI